MRPINIFTILLFVQFCQGQTQGGKVSLDINQQPIHDLFEAIEEQTTFKFSFNSRLLNRDSIITYHCANRLVEKVMKDVFLDGIVTKKIGSHIVLIENEKIKNQLESPLIIVKGVVLDSRTKITIKDASIYGVYSKETVLTDGVGNFQLHINPSQKSRSYYVAKRGYISSILLLRWNTKKSIKIELESLPEVKKVENLYIPIEQKSKFSFGMIPNKSLITTDNLHEIAVTRGVQVSLLPTIGTNWMSKGVVANKFSLNIFAGYNGGVDGLEIGLILNIIEKDVVGAQLAGVLNVVSGKVNGAQVSGLLNRTNGEVKGIQVAGIYNELRDTMYGVQVAGILNRTKGKIKGAQIGGVYNELSSTLRGVQVAGIYNLGRKKISGGQVAGIYNELQDTLHGIQVAGVFNRSQRNNGLQIGLINKSGTNNGLQIGLVNISEKSVGLAIGLFNYSKNGYKNMELVGNEFLQTSLKYKMGAKHFYTIYTLGTRPKLGLYGYGIGVGSRFDLASRSFVSIDITSSVLSSKHYFFRDFNHRLDLLLGFQFSRNFSIFLGPAMNVFVSRANLADIDMLKNDLPKRSLYSHYKQNKFMQIWIGGNIGVGYTF